MAGVVSSLDHDGRIAYVPASALLAADPSAGDDEQLAVRLEPGASAAAVTAALGPSATPATGAVGRGVPLVAVLRSILRAVAIVDGLVCLYALIQACALTVQERRRTISVLRAFGAGATRSGACWPERWLRSWRRRRCSGSCSSASSSGPRWPTWPRAT